MNPEDRKDDGGWLHRWLAVGTTANNESERMRASVGGQRCCTSTLYVDISAGTCVAVDEALAPCLDFNI
jgi:hypothetical protein